MEIKLTLSLDKDALGAVNALTQAISSVGNSVGPSFPTGANTSTDKKSVTKAGPVYWQNSRSGEFGECATSEDYEVLRAAAPKYIKEISEEVFNQLGIETEAEGETEGEEEEAAETPAEKKKRLAEEKKAADAAEKKKAAADAKAKKAAADAKKETSNPTVEDIKTAYLAYMDKNKVVDEDGDFDVDEYERRKEFLKAVTQRLGAKPTECAPELRGEALAMLQSRIEDPDYDPANSVFEEDSDMI